jgi:hypothetical protein
LFDEIGNDVRLGPNLFGAIHVPDFHVNSAEVLCVKLSETLEDPVWVVVHVRHLRRGMDERDLVLFQGLESVLHETNVV